MAPMVRSVANRLSDPSAMASQPFCQCTEKAATAMVTIRGTEIQRTARPSARKMAPSSSEPAASTTMRAGNGRPRPQSGFPNQAAVSSKAANFLAPAIQKMGTR